MRRYPKTVSLITAFVIAAVTALAAVQAPALAASDELDQIIADIESKYALSFSVDNPEYWDAGHLADMRGALDAFPPGMMEQALNFFAAMSGDSIPKVRLKRPRSEKDTYLAITTYLGSKYTIAIDIYNHESVGDTFAHELVHVFHFYLEDNFGDDRLPPLYKALNDGRLYVKDKCFDQRYEEYVGVYFPTAYAMHSYDEDVAELFSMLCFDRTLYGGYRDANVPLYDKAYYTADEFLRRTIRPRDMASGARGQWWYDTFDNGRAFAGISPQLSDWALPSYRAAMDANLLPPDSFLTDDPQASVSRLDYSFLAARLLEVYSGGPLRELAGSLGAGASYTRRTKVPYDDLPKMNRVDLYSNLFYMKELGVMQGDGGARFNPYETLTRAQAAALLTNIAKALGFYTAPPAVTYADAGQIPGWALDGVAYMSHIGVMQGYAGNFSPNEPYSYEQGLISMLNMYNWMMSRSMMKRAA